MLCDECKKDRPDKDFYSSTKCYKCVYNRKVKEHNANVQKIKDSGIATCLYCHNGFKAKGKKRYCSDECIQGMRKRHNDNREHKRINSPGGHWNTNQIWGKGAKGDPIASVCGKCKRVLYEYRQKIFCRFCDKESHFD